MGADTSQDIQLFGIGIQPEHCVLELCPDGDVTLTPIGNARSATSVSFSVLPVNLCVSLCLSLLYG